MGRVSRTGDEPTATAAELRSAAQLKMLHSLALRLSRLGETRQIAEAITTELKTLIDYHNCRVYLLAEDGFTLEPIVFKGELTEYAGETYEGLVTHVGEGFTGHAVEIGRTYYAADALRDPIGVQIPGTPEVEESILAVPMKVGERVVGVIVLSSLGVDRFDEQDIRVVEVLASHAAVAFENARLLAKEREAAETASALLALSQTLTGAHDLGTVLALVTEAVPSLVPCSFAAAYLREPTDGTFRLVRHHGIPEERARRAAAVPPELAEQLLWSTTEPFVLPRDAVAAVPRELWFVDEPTAVVVAPLRFEPDGFAALVLGTPGQEVPPRSLRLLRGIADIASLALGSARRFHELERFHELVESLDAVFWEADPSSLRFTFLSARAGALLGAALPTAWGDHIHPQDRQGALAELRRAVGAGGDHSLEYRGLGAGGRALWLRDLVHVTRDPRGATILRGLMVDITERKQAEEALRRSERTYQEAFRREREAAQRLRALDEMKDTFLEAVSHDLRTPLTSILGSALTLEHGSLSEADAADLVRRIASNARKLERLLSDLLDLDRLQRGIVSPQRRPTHLAELIHQAVRDAELLAGRQVEVEVPEELVANLDTAKVERIVENLLANAARHTPAEARIWVRAWRQDGGVRIAVEDDGPGVPAELREAIFEPFRQAPGRTHHDPGVGIGLTLVARFAELHGGKAWVEDRPGGGASFQVLLPEA
jgi:signal transduction histidine kinase/putative methionine-R-sulfoxide reductase with GAF domain